MAWHSLRKRARRHVMAPETPQNGEYLAAAYVITVVILLGYWGRLWRKLKALRR
jgi:hypothetical protein